MASKTPPSRRAAAMWGRGDGEAVGLGREAEQLRYFADYSSNMFKINTAL